MSNLREAAQQALEALEMAIATGYSMQRSEAICALRSALTEDALQRFSDVNQELEAALAEPVQEQPICDECGRKKADGWALYCVDCMEPVFAAPQRKPLTEEEIEKASSEIWRDLPNDFDHTSAGWIEQGIRYAERAHGITS